MKRLAVIMMALACAVALCACGSTSEAEPEAEEPVVEQDVVVGEYELAGVTCERH